MRLFTAFAILLLTATAAQAEVIRVFIKEVSCPKCARVIERDMRYHPTVKRADLDLPSKSLTIESDTQGAPTNAAITQTIADVGYTVTGIVRKAK